MPLDDFFVKGYYTDILSIDIASEFSNHVFANCRVSDSMDIAQDVKARLNELHLYLAENYVSKIFSSYKILGNGMWDNVDNGSDTWHNDLSAVSYTHLTLPTN